MPNTSQQLAQRMREGLQRYRQLQQHSAPEFLQHVKAVQQWQGDRLRRSHAELLENLEYLDAAEFFLNDIYGGVDLNELAGDIERAMNKALRVLPANVMSTAATALELNALAAELDERLTQCLLDMPGTMSGSILTFSEQQYVQAFKNSAHVKLRSQQVDLVERLAHGLDRYVRSRMVYATYKVLRRPAHMAGVGSLYDFLGRGFEVMHPLGKASDFVKKITAHESRVISRIYEDHSDPFAFKIPNLSMGALA